MKKTTLSFLLVASVCTSALTFATETENLGIRVLPAPGKVAIDGKFDDWDLSGGILACSDVENLRDQYSVWFFAMYDDKNVYLLARWSDPTPLNNPGSTKGDMGFAGDCLQFRFATHYEQKGLEQVSHWTCWRDRDGVDVMDLAYGRSFNEGGLRDAKTKDAQQAFVVNADGKGYVQEMAIPWALITKDGQPLKPGDSMRMALEPNYTAGAFGRVTIKDIFKEGIVPDRVFTFRAYGQWGIATLEKSGKLKPRPVRLSDNREFQVTLGKGLPTVNWTGLIVVKEPPGFRPVVFTMPADGYVSLNIFNKDGAVVRQLLNCAFYTQGKHEVKWDGLTTPYWRKPGEPVEAGDYTWKAITHTGIGLRLRGWACNGGNAPWDSTLTSNWGGDHGVPFSCVTDPADGGKVYLGWTGAEAGKGVLACDLQGNVQWKHLHGGMGGAEVVAVDGGIVYVDKWANLIYRVDTKTGTYNAWRGKETAELPISAIWESPVGMPDRIEGMDARNGKLYITCSAAFFRRADVKDWKPLLEKIHKGEGLAKTINQKLGSWSKQRLPWWLDQNPGTSMDEACGSPNYYTPDVRDDVVSILNGLLNDTTMVADAAKLSADDLAQANRRFIEKAFAADLVPMKMNFLAVLDAQTGKVIKLIDVDKPRFVRAVNDTLVYVVSDRRQILAVDPTSGSVKTVIKGLENAFGVTPDDKGQLYVSVQNPDHQVRVFSADGKPLSEIGRKGGYPEVGPWTPDGMRNPAGLVIDKEGKLWVAEATASPKRISMWDLKTGKLLKDFFGPTHYGASGGAINPRDPNIMAGEGCEWRIDPQTGRDVCLGIFEQATHQSAIYAEGNNGKLYLGTFSEGTLSIRERLGDGNFVLRGSIVSENDKKVTTFWADENGDQRQQPAELATHPAALCMGGYYGWSLNMNGDLTLYANSLQFKATGFTPCGAPKYDVAGARKVGDFSQGALSTPDNRKVLSVEEAWYKCFDTASGKLLWTYPNTFSGVHGSHAAPPPEVGLIRGAFGLVGNALLPKPVGGIWGINGNIGEWHVLTEDGFYLTRIFQGDGFKVQWPDQAVPGAIMDNCPPGLGGEDFGGSMRQGKDGKVYVQAGKTGLWNIEVAGLDSLKEIPGGKLSLSANDIQTAQKFREEQLQAAEGTKKCTAKKGTPAFTGNPDGDFKGVEFINFKKMDNASVHAAAMWDDTNLYLAWVVGDETPWVNGADAPEFMYCRGDTVDFQIGADPKADKNRADPVKGDLRLSIGNFQAKATAVVYRKIADEKKPKMFSSGVIKEYPMDSVVVLDNAKIEAKVDGPGKRYVVEAAIPLATLGLKITDGLALRGDFGVTHGDKAGADTALRTHWNNQTTGIVNDEVFELRMEPKNWGEITFQ